MDGPIWSVSEDSKFSPSEHSPLLSSVSKRAQTIDEALESTGVGFFHFILILVTGWALASDSVEVYCVSALCLHS